MMTKIKVIYLQSESKKNRIKIVYLFPVTTYREKEMSKYFRFKDQLYLIKSLRVLRLNDKLIFFIYFT